MSDVEDAADVWAAIQVVLVTSVRSVLHAGTLAASGVYMGKTGVMTQTRAKNWKKQFVSGYCTRAQKLRVFW